MPDNGRPYHNLIASFVNVSFPTLYRRNEKGIDGNTVKYRLRDILEAKTTILIGKRVKLVRHAGGGEKYKELTKHRYGFLQDQQWQVKDIFKGCDYIASFIGLERSKSLFAGVFEVKGVQQQDGRFLYDLEPIPDFDDLIDRLVIDWGGSAVSWHQWYNAQPKEVVEILPRGYLGHFPGLLDFVLDYDELQKLIANPDANADWRHHLSAVNGIYLILDTHTGQQYIGSAYGKAGIWQRWSEYAKTGTGGNKELIRLLDVDQNYCQHFRFSVLQTLPSNITPAEVVAVENLYKEKMGSRVHGLNAN